MSNSLLAERAKYEAIWEITQYADTSPGEQFAPVFDALVKERCVGRGTVLDAGCGGGRGGLALSALGYDVTLCDLTPAGLTTEAQSLPFFETALWDDLVPKSGFTFFEWVYCCDVLEHLPTEYVGLALHRLLQVSRRGVFLSISLGSDNLGVWVGQPLHQTVRVFEWWRDLLASFGHVVEARDLITTGVYLVEPR